MIQTMKFHWDQLANNLWPEQGTAQIRPFYFEFVPLDRIFQHVYDLNLSHEENHELVSQIIEIIHFEMLTTLLDYIPEQNHVELVTRLHHESNPHVLLGGYDLSTDVVLASLRRKGQNLHETLLITLINSDTID